MSKTSMSSTYHKSGHGAIRARQQRVKDGWTLIGFGFECVNDGFNSQWFVMHWERA